MALFRGITKEQEQKPSLLIRDTRTLGQRIHGYFQEQKNCAVVLLVISVSLFLPLFKSFTDIFFLLGLFLLGYGYKRKIILPFKLPKSSELLDPNDLKPGSNIPYEARGITFYGNDVQNEEELWFTNEDMRTHTLIFGATGSGKTEALLSIAYNSLVQGSGFIYVDGKGDNSLFSKIFSMARFAGREDDVLLINFMTGARDIVGAQERKLSNTLNPFSSGSSSMLAQIIVGQMDSGKGGSSDADMWKGRAIAFVEALMKLLVYMRDQEHILLDANIIRNYFVLERLEIIVIDHIFPRDDQEPVKITDIPDIVVQPLRNYVINLPGYNKNRKGNQVSQVSEQHGFITMQLTRVFTSLADTYGHILRTEVAEVDLKDVILNRRILVVLLPALEKSLEELANLGKIVIASLKVMLASGLGEDVEGSYENIVLKKATNSPTPFVCILDEYGYYAVEGFAVVPAQARSLGFSVIFAGQDLPAFQKASKEEAASIGANTNIKIVMKLEDPVETWDFVSKTAGEAFVTKVDAFQVDTQNVANMYRDTKSSSSEKRARVDLLDLKDQGLGEAHIFFKSMIVRAKMFFANPKPVPYMRLNHFVRVRTPRMTELVEFKKRLISFDKLFSMDSLNISVTDITKSEDFTTLLKSYESDEQEEGKDRNLFALGVDTMVALLREEGQQEGENGLPYVKPLEIVDDDKIYADNLDIFKKVELLSVVREIMGSEFDSFAQPILNKKETIHYLESIEILSGKKSTLASKIALTLITDIEYSTAYPSAEIRTTNHEDRVVANINELIELLSS